MEENKSRFIKWECKVHGLTDFYTYKNGERYKCVTCARKKSKEWKEKNLEKSVSNLNEWHRKNPSKIEQYRKKAVEEYRKKSKEKSEDFYKEFGPLINDISTKIGLKKISKRIKNIKDPNKEKIFHFLMQARRGELIMYHRYGLSALVKWEHLKSSNLKNATDEQKKTIREEYKMRAEKIVDLEIIKILENYNKNK
jgi:hypothetical protein